MTTKMKGLLKGLRYISQIFDSEKEQEMQIGHPTDVKHVAHIGCDGPTNVHSPSWMNDFKSPTVFSGGADAQNSSDRSATEETSRKTPGDAPVELPKSSRRQPFVSSMSADGFTGDSPAKPRHSRRQCASGSSDPLMIDSPKRGKPSRASGPPSLDSPKRGKPSRTSGPPSLDSPNRSKPSPRRSSLTLSLPDIPGKSLRKKSRESNAAGGSSGLGNGSQPLASAYVAPFSDPGTGTGSGSVPGHVSNLNDCELYPKSPLKPGQLNQQRNGIS